MDFHKILFINYKKNILLKLGKRFINENYLKLFFANNIEDGLDIINKNEIDVIVSDQKMLEMSGVDLFKIAKDNQPDALCILLISKKDFPETIRIVDNGEIYHYIINPWNIRELKSTIKSAVDYVKLKKENKTLLKEIDHCKLELETVNKNLEVFSYSLSHDLKNTLQAVNSFLQIIKEKYESKFDVEFRRLFKNITNNIQQMNKLIENILELYNIENIQVAYKIINQNEVINKVILEIINNNSNNQSINWKIRNVPPVYTNYDLIYQVWIILVSNAVKYSSKKRNPIIEITGIIKGNQVICSVRDNGVGFGQAHVSKLFIAFQRLYHESEFPGSGIGLAIVEKIIEKHGGKVWANGELDKGRSSFFFTK